MFDFPIPDKPLKQKARDISGQSGAGFALEIGWAHREFFQEQRWDASS